MSGSVRAGPAFGRRIIAAIAVLVFGVTLAIAEAPAKHNSITAEREALFAELSGAEGAAATALANKIAINLLHSGSATVNLLMQRAGYALEHQNYPLALDLLDAVIRLAPDYSEGWHRRSVVHFLREDYGKAIADLRETLAREPRHFNAMAGLAAILAQLEKESAAHRILERVLKIYPAFEKARKAFDELNEKMMGKPI